MNHEATSVRFSPAFCEILTVWSGILVHPNPAVKTLDPAQYIDARTLTINPLLPGIATPSRRVSCNHRNGVVKLTISEPHNGSAVSSLYYSASIWAQVTSCHSKHVLERELDTFATLGFMVVHTKESNHTFEKKERWW